MATNDTEKLDFLFILHLFCICASIVYIFKIENMF